MVASSPGLIMSKTRRCPMKFFSVRCRPRSSLVLPLKPGVSGSPGGRSLRRFQEHLSLHSSSLKRKLSTSIDALSCHSSGTSTRAAAAAAASKLRPAPSPAARAAEAVAARLPNGVPPSSSRGPPGGCPPAGSGSEPDDETRVEDRGLPTGQPPREQRRLIRQMQSQQQTVPNPGGISMPDGPSSAAAEEKPQKVSRQQQHQQQQKGRNSQRVGSSAGTSTSDRAGNCPTLM